MQQTKIKVNLSDLARCSLVPLYARMKISKENSSLFNDAKAIKLVELIDYDFSAIEKSAVDYVLFTTVVGAMQFDNKIKTYISEHPRASVVSLGAGFETEFYRVDNGTIHWYDLDLPEVIKVKKQLIPETDRVTYIAKSLLDPSWHQEISTEGCVFIIAAGLLRYFGEAEARQLFLSLADHFPGCEIVFDAESKLSNVFDGNFGAFGAGWSDDEPERRDAIQKELFKSFKNEWMIIPHDLKYKMLGVLITPTKPKSTEWKDIEIWWNQLSDQEKGKAMSNFATFLCTPCKCPLENANEMTKWDDRITVIDQFPLFKNIPRNSSLTRSVRQFMDYTDEKERIKIFHIRV